MNVEKPITTLIGELIGHKFKVKDEKLDEPWEEQSSP